jgi:hypothetical protein
VVYEELLARHPEKAARYAEAWERELNFNVKRGPVTGPVISAKAGDLSKFDK